MPHSRPSFALSALFALSLIASGSAEAGGHTDQGGFAGPPQGWSIGLGTFASNGVYVGEDSTAMVVPTVRYDGPRLSASLVDGISYKFGQGGAVSWSARLSPRLNGLGRSDAPDLAGLARDFITVDGGAELTYAFGYGTQLSASVLTELTSEHGGTEATLGLAQPIPLGRIPLFVEASASWQSADLSAFFYGVSASEATGTRAAYAPGDVVIPQLSVRTIIPINDSIAAFAALSAEFLPSEVTNSPIVDEDVSYRMILAVSYNF